MKFRPILGVVLVLVLAAAGCTSSSGGDDSTTTTQAAVTTTAATITTADPNALEWSFDSGEEGLVTLRTSDPLGSSQVLVDGELLPDSASGDWVSGFPGDVAYIDQVVRDFSGEARCTELEGAIDTFASEAGAGSGAEATKWAAFAAYAMNAAAQAGCS